MKNCKVCQKDFEEISKLSICCSRECYRKNSISRNPLYSQFAKFNGSTATKGAIQELKVSADLLRKGYHVFRAVSPSAHCDLIIIDKKGKLKRVEVRSAVKNKSGKFFFSRNGHYDLIAFVFKNKIMYEHSSRD